MLRDITLDYETKEACRIARLARLRAKQDRLFAKNMKAKQNIIGVIICLIAIAAFWYVSEFYNQFLHILSALPMVCLGAWLILTDRNFEAEERFGEKENR